MEKRRIIQKSQGAYILMGQTDNTENKYIKIHKLMGKPALHRKGHCKEVTAELRPERREETKYLKS